MPSTRLESLKIKAKLLQKAKRRNGKPFALKDAFALIAEAAGFSSWRDMKNTLDVHELLRPPHASALWSVWYGSYEEAKKHLQEQDEGGFLLPYQKQFFICDTNYIANLGIELDDSDLQKVGANWVEPKNAAAWQRLLAKIAKGPR